MTPVTLGHRGGSGPPLVCLHGFLDTWRTWELVLPALERRHDVLAVTLTGQAGAILATEAGRRRATRLVSERFEHIRPSCSTTRCSPRRALRRRCP